MQNYSNSNVIVEGNIEDVARWSFRGQTLSVHYVNENNESKVNGDIEVPIEGPAGTVVAPKATDTEVQVLVWTPCPV